MTVELYRHTQPLIEAFDKARMFAGWKHEVEPRPGEARDEKPIKLLRATYLF